MHRIHPGSCGEWKVRGRFFGLWWTPNNPLMDEYRKNKETDWEPYYLTADAKRTVEVYSTFWDSKYVVVRKGYEHPEIVMKILSVLFDYSRYEAEDADEVNSYFCPERGSYSASADDQCGL